MTVKYDDERPDYRIISGWVEEGSSVLDLGCGGGELLQMLSERKKVRGQGIEIDERAIYGCVEKGVDVSHGDIDSVLSDYEDDSFDYCILNQSLQQTVSPDKALSEAMRAGRRVIAGFPNFAHLRARWRLAARGRAPVTPALPYRWHDTPNLHFLSIADFYDYCREKDVRIEKRAFFSGMKTVRLFPNIAAGAGLFLISGRRKS
jgi:methionine biosynthesis protein MetW